MPLLRNIARAAVRGKWKKRMGKRGVIGPKRGNNQYYKGKGGRRIGVHTDKGGFVVRPRMLMEIQMPDLEGFKLKPYVHPSSRKVTAADLVFDVPPPPPAEQ